MRLNISRSSFVSCCFGDFEEKEFCSPTKSGVALDPALLREASCELWSFNNFPAYSTFVLLFDYNAAAH